MSKQRVKRLDVSTEPPPNAASNEKISMLTEALARFTKEAEKLQIAYAELKEQYQNINKELETSNRALQNKLVEFDAVTSYLSSILSNISQGILFIDFSGGITTYNPAAEKILGKSGDQVLFQSFWSSFDDECFGFSMRKALSVQEAPGTAYASFLREDGEKRELEIESGLVLRKEKALNSSINAMQGLIVLIRDITEIRRLQSIANRHDRLKELGEMAAMVAHEIRNPLGGIKGFAMLLKRDLSDHPEMQKMAQHIVEGTDHLNHLVTTVLNYARPVKPEIEWADLIHFGQELLDHLKADANTPSTIVMHLEAKASVILAPIDPNLMRSALLNLMVNAIQAMPDKGDLTLELDLQNDHAVIAIADTGVGIPPENFDKLYSPFFTTRPEGNGFGLAEVLKIVQAHGGTIEVVSSVGKGTTFTIKIPLKIKG